MDNHQLLSHDVKSEYISCRKLGLGREAAVQKLLEAYSEELQDPDDAPAVIEGIVCALRIKRELSHKIAEQLQGCLSSLPYTNEKSRAAVGCSRVLWSGGRVPAQNSL